jgi:hypothetical protein
MENVAKIKILFFIDNKCNKGKHVGDLKKKKKKNQYGP